MKSVNPWLFAPERMLDSSRPVRRNTSIGGLSFPVEVDGENIPMRISEDALRTVFGAARSPAGWLAVYRANAQAIDARAAAAHREAPTRPVCLETGDFQVVPA